VIKGFREFILRGNVIDLAVAVVIGTAFTNIVNTIVMGILNPAIGALFSTASLAKALPVAVPPLLHGGLGTTIYFGALIGAVIQFVLVAVVVYFALVVPINYVKNRAAERKAKGQPPADDPITELDLLTDIRDLLAKNGEPATK
jgi:large conductance mechanosensitive channel